MTSSTLATYSKGSGNPTDAMLSVTPPRGSIDPLGLQALKETQKYFQEHTHYRRARQLILREKGLASYVQQVSNRLNNDRGLDDINRLLFACPEVYAAVVQISKEYDDVQDAEGLYNSVLRYIDKPRKYFLARLLADILDAKYIQFGSTNNSRRKRLSQLILAQGISIREGELISSVMNLIEIIHHEGNIPDYLDNYIDRKEINPSHFTPSVKQSIVDYLVELGVEIPDNWHSEHSLNGVGHQFDEYFALAYSRAQNQGTETDDPINAIYGNGNPSQWNFNVNTFDSIERQGIESENILAAGALDYIYCVGEQMHVFDVANALVLRWASGMLDIPDGTTAASLYTLHKKRETRSTPEERAMLYKRVLNKGNGKLLQRMVPNGAFTNYWNQLMTEVAQYIQKTERKAVTQSWNNNSISTTHLYQITRDLQYNLTEYMTGMAHLQVTEDYAHLQEALDIINSDEIRNYFGGRRKSVWSVIEQLTREELGVSVQSETIKTLAIEGNKIFQWIARFESGDLVTQDDFETFLRASESWIIAQASLGSTRMIPAIDSAVPHHQITTHQESMHSGNGVYHYKSSDAEYDEFGDW